VIVGAAGIALKRSRCSHATVIPFLTRNDRRSLLSEIPALERDVWNSERKELLTGLYFDRNDLVETLGSRFRTWAKEISSAYPCFRRRANPSLTEEKRASFGPAVARRRAAFFNFFRASCLLSPENLCAFRGCPLSVSTFDLDALEASCFCFIPPWSHPQIKTVTTSRRETDAARVGLSVERSIGL
jgi:hypothetical protein